MSVSRRGFLAGLGGLLAAPVIVRAIDPIFVRRGLSPIGTEFYTATWVDGEISPAFVRQFNLEIQHAFRRRERDGYVLGRIRAELPVYQPERRATMLVHSARTIGYAD